MAAKEPFSNGMNMKSVWGSKVTSPKLTSYKSSKNIEEKAIQRQNLEAEVRFLKQSLTQLQRQNNQQKKEVETEAKKCKKLLAEAEAEVEKRKATMEQREVEAKAAQQRRGKVEAKEAEQIMCTLVRRHNMLCVYLMCDYKWEDMMAMEEANYRYTEAERKWSAATQRCAEAKRLYAEAMDKKHDVDAKLAKPGLRETIITLIAECRRQAFTTYVDQLHHKIRILVHYKPACFGFSTNGDANHPGVVSDEKNSDSGLQGDGIMLTERSGYMSLSFQIMKGQLDDALEWPFRHTVTFKVINQIGGKDITKTIAPDTASSCFQRPTQEMNPPIEFPCLVPEAELKSFLKDGKIVIQCHICCNQQ